MNGEKAITLATKACEETEWKAAHIISTLAAGYAENGDFEKACEYSHKALDTDGGNGGIDEQLQKELSSYEEKKPWREKQSMPEAELQMKETPDCSSRKQNPTKKKLRESKVHGSGQQKPRRPFD